MKLFKKIIGRDNIHIYWLPLVVLFIHSTDELLSGFPAWATNHFGTTTVGFFIYTHIALLMIVGTISYYAVNRGQFWRFLALIAMAQFATNALFHIVTSFLYSEITPGIYTALLVCLPLAFLFFRVTVKSKLTPTKYVVSGAVLGIATALLIIASLWL